MTDLRAGDWVEVRSKAEILRTLDRGGRRDGMPFMPEMFAYCGQKFRVYRRAHKACDTVFPVQTRRVPNAVHLETRCNGSAHGGCQARCLIFWNEAWLRPVSGRESTVAPSVEEGASAMTEADVQAATLAPGTPTDRPVYSCQATQLPYATSKLAWWDLRQYVEDYTSGNTTLWQIACGTVYSLVARFAKVPFGVGALVQRTYDWLHPLFGGTPFPRKPGTIPVGESTPTGSLDLQPGELVRVKSHDEILRTLTTDSKNRGMFWDAEMVPFCGRTYRVLSRVTRLIDERNGKMLEVKSPCIILDEVFCQSRFSYCRMFCPRAIYPYWREIWLERVAEPPRTNAGASK